MFGAMIDQKYSERITSRKRTSSLLFVVSSFTVILRPSFANGNLFFSLPSKNKIKYQRSSSTSPHHRRCEKFHRPTAFIPRVGDARMETEKLRGGSLFKGKSNSSMGGKDPSQSSTGDERISIVSKIKATSLAALFTLVVAVLASSINWSSVKRAFFIFFDRDKLRAAVIKKLNEVSQNGLQGLLIYSISFCVWEACGLPTSIVETAAGMAFGFRKGLLGSFLGKTCGSILAFQLGRTLLSTAVRKQMEKSETMQLIDQSVTRNPIRSALIVRYSVFPQLIKNFGLSLTKPVTLPIFIAAIVVHGFPFSLLWASLGDDSSMRLRAAEAGESLAANVVLNGILVFVTMFGLVVSPIVTGWWIADLRHGS